LEETKRRIRGVWFGKVVLPVLVPVIISALVAVGTVYFQIRGAIPLQTANIDSIQQTIYQSLYENLNSEISRLRESHTTALAEIRADYNAQISGLRQSLVDQSVAYESRIAAQEREIERLNREIIRLELIINNQEGE